MKYVIAILTFLLSSTYVMGQIQNEAVCENDSLTIELPTFTANDAIQWRSAPDSINFTDIAGANSNTITISPTTETYYYASIQGDNCDPYNSDTIFVTVSQQPSAADAGSNITDSTNSTTLNAVAPTVGQGTWTILPGSGSNGVFSNSNDPQSTFTGDPNETYILAWTVENPPCNSTADTIIVNLGVASSPPLPSVPCLNSTLYVHPTDNAAPMGWGCAGSGTAQASSDVDGQSNTSLIMTNCPSPATTAGAVCANLVAFGFSDWYLPAYDELLCVRDSAASIGGFSSGAYWASTEGTGIFGANARYRTFPSGVSGFGSKNNNNRVRCVRK